MEGSETDSQGQGDPEKDKIEKLLDPEEILGLRDEVKNPLKN